MINVAEEMSKRAARPVRKAEKKELDRMTITPAESGGHVIEHHFKHDSMGPYHEPETHIVKTHSALKKHMDEHCTCGGTGEGEE